MFSGYLLFCSAFLSLQTLGVQAHLPNCWRGAWSEKGWETLL